MAHQYPELNPYGTANGSSYESTKNSVFNNAQSAMYNIKNSDAMQTFANGPVAEKARVEADNTRNEFSNLAAARHTPQTQTATGQNLTHYHSFFYHLLSWENPRATAISYTTIVFFILSARYVPVTRYILKALYTILGITAAAEVAGKIVFGEGFSSKMRPKKYYTIPRETLESMVVDAAELANFFVIEFQRIVFAENIYATIGGFTAAIISYFLIKFMPSWGLALLLTTVAFFAPLAYMQNQEIIDEHLSNAHNIVSEQANQVRDLAAQHTNKAVEMSQIAFKEYSSKAQEMLGQGKKAAVKNNVITPETAEKIVPEPTIKSEDFPSAPQVPLSNSNGIPTGEAEPLLAS